MKEIITLLINFKFKALFFEPTKNSLLQFFRYAFVGGIATIADWLVQYVFTIGGLHYLLSAVLAFIAGLVCNFCLSKLFVFNGQAARVGKLVEFLSYGVIGLIGLAMTILIMYVATDIFGIYFMIAKIVATFIVLFWNYISRKLLLYKK